MLGVGEAACAEEIIQQSVLWKNLRMGDMKQRNTQRERERGREAQRGITLLTIMQQLQNEQQPFQKVTKSLYIVTHLGQLPFMLFTQMARTWAIKEDSVNTSIIHWYSIAWMLHELAKEADRVTEVGSSDG